MSHAAGTLEWNKGGRDTRVVLLGARAEQRWLERTPGRPSFRCSPGDWHLVDEWLADALVSTRFRGLCAQWASQHLSLECANVLKLSAPLRAVFAERLRSSSDESFRNTARLCAEVLGWSAPILTDPAERWAALSSFVPIEELPLWIVDMHNCVRSALEESDRLARAGAFIGLRVKPEIWREFIAGDVWGRSATRWRMAPVLSEESESEGNADSETESFIQSTAPDALPLLRSAREALSVPDDELTRQQRARSAAEALLFAVIEARPRTKGRFLLNAPLDFSFGTRIAEGDLTAVEARLVVEIDGYYHFRDAEGYRRDRRKDAMLQEHGWFVMRFLAEDVVSHLETVMLGIEHTLARRDAVRISQYKP